MERIRTAGGRVERCHLLRDTFFELRGSLSGRSRVIQGLQDAFGPGWNRLFTQAGGRGLFGW